MFFTNYSKSIENKDMKLNVLIFVINKKILFYKMNIKILSDSDNESVAQEVRKTRFIG